MYGFTLRYSGWQIFCACGKSHQQLKSNDDPLTSDLGSGSKRKRANVSDLECPFFISASPVIRPVAKDGISKKDRVCKVTGMELDHNHPLSKKMLVQAKQATKKYTIAPTVLRKIMEMMESGPLPTKTLRTFMQKQYPEMLVITSTMVCNVRMKVKYLLRKYGNSLNDVPSYEINRVFHPNSLEVAPQDWDNDPTFAKVYKDAMMEVLSGDGLDCAFPIFRIMNHIKSSQIKGYDYRVYTSNTCGRPQGIMHMLPAMVQAFIRYGDVIALDVQNRAKNTYGWNGCFPSGTNNNKKLQNFCDSLTLVEEDRFYAWIVRSMCDISGRPLQTIKIIAIDGRLSEVPFRKHLPGKFRQSSCFLLFLYLFFSQRC